MTAGRWWLLWLVPLLLGLGAAPAVHAAPAPSYLGSAPSWDQYVSATGAPMSFANGTFVFAGNQAGDLLYGGITLSGYSNQTWLFTGAPGYPDWGLRYETSPAAREGAVSVSAPTLGGALYFGGRNNTTTFDDTWLFSGTALTWQELAPARSPPPVAFAAAAWSNRPSGVMLFGGESASGQALNTTWFYANGTWTQQTLTPSPPARWGASLVYDPADSTDYLFGGTNGTSVLGDFWALHNGTWSEITGVPGPSPRAFVAATTTGGGYPLLYGGAGPQGTLGDTWMYLPQNHTWENLTPLFAPGAPAPSPAAGASLVEGWDLGTNVFVLAGGAPLTDQVISPWILSIPFGGSPGGLAGSIALSVTSGTTPLKVTLTASATGGTAPYSYTWNFGDGTATAVGTTVTHVFRTNATGTFTITLSVRDAVGDTARTTASLHVKAPPPPAPPPLVIPWPLIVAGVVLIGLILLGLSILTVKAALFQQHQRAILADLGVNRHIPFPFALAPLFVAFVRDRDLRSFLWAAKRRTQEAWETVWHSRAPATLRRRAQAFWALETLLSVLSKLIFVVTVVYFLESAARDSLPGASHVTTLGYLQGWGSALGNFFSGAWFAATLSYNYGTVPIMWYFTSSLELILVALALSALLAYPLGLLSGWNRGGKLDAVTRGYSTFGLYFSTIALCFLVLGWAYAAWLYTFGWDSSFYGILPISAGWYFDHLGGVPAWLTLYGTTTPTGFPIIDVALHNEWSLEEIVVIKTLLQGLIIALIYSAVYLRYLRFSVAEAAEEPHLTASRARGVSERRLLWHHASRRALPLYVSAFSTTFSAFLITEAIVEYVFGDIGIGGAVMGMLNTSLSQSSVFELVPIIYIFAIMVVIVNVVADVLVRFLDPRVSASGLLRRSQ